MINRYLRKNKLFSASKLNVIPDNIGPFKNPLWMGSHRLASLSPFRKNLTIRNFTSKNRLRSWIENSLILFTGLYVSAHSSSEASCMHRGGKILKDIAKGAGEKMNQSSAFREGTQLCPAPISSTMDKKGVAYSVGDHIDPQTLKHIAHQDDSGVTHPGVYALDCGKQICTNLVCGSQDQCAQEAGMANPYRTYIGNLTHSKEVQGKETLELNPSGTRINIIDEPIAVPSDEIIIRKGLTEQGFRNGNHQIIHRKILEEQEEHDPPEKF